MKDWFNFLESITDNETLIIIFAFVLAIGYGGDVAQIVVSGFLGYMTGKEKKNENV